MRAVGVPQQRVSVLRRVAGVRHAVTLAVAGVVVAAVGATVFAGTGFARFDMAEYGALCEGGAGVPDAAPYTANGPSPVYLGQDLAQRTIFGPSAVWHPRTPAAVQLVACVSEGHRGALVRTCRYGPGPGQPVGRTLNLFTRGYRLTVYQARTGERVADVELTGEQFAPDPAVTDPDPCREAAGAPEDGLPGRRYSRLAPQQIEAALAPYAHLSPRSN